MITNFKLVGNFDISSIKPKLKDLDWDSFTWRIENSVGNHSKTKSVPIIFDENRKTPIKQKNYILFKDELDKLSNVLESVYGDGILFTALLINLPAQEKIGSHIDVGENFELAHRIHIPVITNNKCLFTVGGETKNLKEGEMWEIDNDGKYHDVVNDGDIDRIHLLVDWKPMKKEKTLL